MCTLRVNAPPQSRQIDMGSSWDMESAQSVAPSLHTSKAVSTSCLSLNMQAKRRGVQYCGTVVHHSRASLPLISCDAHEYKEAASAVAPPPFLLLPRANAQRHDIAGG